MLMYRSFKYALKRGLLLNLDCLVAVGGTSSVPNGVAIVRLDAIGDFIIWLDSAKEYRRLFPDKRITLIANTAWADLARCLPYWDEVWGIDVLRFTQNIFYRWKWLRTFSRSTFELTFQPTYSRVLLLGDSVIRASRAIQRLGSVGDLSNMSTKDKDLGDRWYTQLLPVSAVPIMELRRNAEFYSQFAGQAYSASLPKLPVLVALDREKQPESMYFVIFPGASWQGRQWPIQSFAKILHHLHRCYNWQAVLCGSLADRALCEAIAIESRVDCLNFAGRTTLAELTELIRGARLLIGNETSAVHIATAVGTAAVCILGGGHFGRFLPYPESLEGLKPLIAMQKMPCFGCNWHCDQPHDPVGPVPCISKISVELVTRRAAQAIEQSHQHGLLPISTETM
jgi:ADP-heptose:LPS heptosyltransferase